MIMVRISMFITAMWVFAAHSVAPCAAVSRDRELIISCSSEPENITHARERMLKAQKDYEDRKAEIKEYYQSGRYEQDVVCVVRLCKRYIDSVTPLPCKSAVIFDIDDTCFSSLSYNVDQDFIFDQTTYDVWQSNIAIQPIASILDLFHYIKNKGITIFFVTGRKEKDRAITQEHLETAGFKGGRFLFFRPTYGPKPHAAIYKTKVRKRIEDKGYTILASIGDQESDLIGGHTRKGFKLPNPLYIIR